MEVQNTTKYYTPDISDLFVGYECEKLIKLIGEYDDIDKVKPSWAFSSIREFDFEIYSMGKIRTPYLTKEQIEKEGWKECHTYAGNKTIDFIHPFDENIFLRLMVDTKEVMIWYDTDDLPDYRFLGNCPSINELRIITKLLNIPKCQNQELTKNPNPL